MSKYIFDLPTAKSEAVVWGIQGDKNKDFINQSLFILHDLRKRAIEKGFSALYDSGRWGRNDEVVLDLLNKLSKVFSKRFGANFNVRVGYDLNACAYVACPSVRTMSQDFRNLFEICLKQLKRYKFLPKERKYDAYNINNKEIFENIINNMNLLNKKIKEGMLKIDINEIKFVDCENITFDFLVGFPDFFFPYKEELAFTNREILAIMLHEIGHLFENLHGLNTEFIEQNILYEELEYLAKQNKTPKEILNILYKDKNGIIRGEEYKGDNDIIVLAKFSRDLIHRHKKLGYGRNINLNKELEADKFSVAFNMGKDLASGLDKLFKVSGMTTVWRTQYTFDTFGRYGNIIQRTYIFRLFVFFANLTMLAVDTAVLAGYTLSFGLFGLLYGLGLILVNHIVIFTLLITFNTEPTLQTYRSPKERISYIKREVIKILKRTKMETNPDLYKDLLSQIREIEAIENDTTNLIKMKTIFGTTYGEYIRLCWSYLNVYQESNESYMLERRMEDLIHNMLYVAKAELEALEI